VCSAALRGRTARDGCPGYHPATPMASQREEMAPPAVRLADLVALLSLGTDLGLGQPMEHMIRATLIALRLAERLGLDDARREVLYYSGLLAWVGCHTDAYEQAKWLGDDLAIKGEAHYGGDMGKPGPAAAFMLRNVGGAGRPLVARARIGAVFLREGRRALQALAENHYLATDVLAERLGLGDEVRKSLGQSYERWDGKGPQGLRGEAVSLEARLMNLADVAEAFRSAGGIDAAVAVAQSRRGSQFDPGLVDMLASEAADIFAEIDGAAVWDLVIAAEPSLARRVRADDLDRALEAIGEFAELKSPWTMGHARRVAQLAAEAGRAQGLAPYAVAALRRASLLHDIGNLGVSNSIWDKRGPLSPAELERVRLHPYLTERMLSYSSSLAPLGTIAGQHHERIDGSGYPRGLRGDAISPAAKILAAADVHVALREERPYRAALSEPEAAKVLLAEVSAGRIDRSAADAVLRAAGHHVPVRRDWPDGLTSREVQVLRLLALGLSNREIAERLVISAKTAGTHIENIYSKVGVSNRAQASVFAMRHSLVGDPITA
jgi:HD-GYP domain-containing protein (c-di-GMP phosphodiesterase class II)/DNA-binding CsgD family transcriptional regulator